MRIFVRLLDLGAKTFIGLFLIAFMATAISLRADTACISDCDATISHLSDISGFEDVEAGPSGFDIFFRPDFPTEMTGQSSLADSVSPSSVSESTGGSSSLSGDGGTLSFVSTDGVSDTPAASDNLGTVLSQVLGAPNLGTPANPGPTDPSAAPEPRYSALAVLGLGWAGLLVLKFAKSRRGDIRIS